MTDKILEVKNLNKKFGNFTAVDDLSLDINYGEVLGLLGPNGAGKTTTIQMLLGLTAQTSGSVSYFGMDFQNKREEILKQINFSSTYISLPWFFTVWEILNVFAMLYEVPDKKKRIKRLLEEFEIEDLVKKQYYMLSAGERTRLLLTKSFLNYPKIILLDEPTASLDVEIAVKIRKFIAKQKKEYNLSVLLTSHNMAEVEELCDRVMVIKNGKIVAHDTPENLAKSLSKCKIEITVKDGIKVINFLKISKYTFENDKNHFNITVEEKNVAEFLMHLSKSGIEYSEISIDKPSLEDFFLKIVKD